VVDKFLGIMLAAAGTFTELGIYAYVLRRVRRLTCMICPS
jgi:hypothetical protein